MPEPERCDQEIFDKGTPFCMADACKHRAEIFVKRIAEVSKQRVDWHYAGGRVIVLCLGDVEAAKEAVRLCVDELARPMPRKRGECGSCSDHVWREAKPPRVKTRRRRKIIMAKFRLKKRNGKWIYVESAEHRIGSLLIYGD
jgi:hypothetical protein